MNSLRPGLRRWICFVAGLTLLLSSGPSAHGEITADFVTALTVRITVQQKGGEALCHGFVYAVRRNQAFIGTALHCFGDYDKSQQLSRTLVFYSNGGTGVATDMYPGQKHDVATLVAPFTQRPFAYTDLCPHCKRYIDAYGPCCNGAYTRLLCHGQCLPFNGTGLEHDIEIVSMLSAGGGPPVPSYGVMVKGTSCRASASSHQCDVVLPAAHGTSGAPVFDLNGNFVGLVVSIFAVTGAQSSVITQIVMGNYVANDIDRAMALSGP